MKIRWTPFVASGALLLGLAACGPADANTAANEAAATAGAAIGADAVSTAAAMLNDPTVQAMANEAAATIEAAANDPTVQAMANEAAATAAAMANDPTAQAMANEAAATAGAMAADPTVQAALDQAFSGTNNTVTLNQGQALALDTLSSVPGVTNWKMTLVDAPTGADANEGQVIKEASGGNISVNPDEYAKYFTTAGDYRVRLDLTTDAGAASQELTVTVP